MNEPVPLVDIQGLSVVFKQRRMFATSTAFRALTAVDLRIGRGEVVGLVGESGSGKTTLGRALLGLVPIETGSISVDGMVLGPDTRPPSMMFRKQVQAVFQDPLQALNPRHDVEQIVGEPLTIHFGLSRRARRSRVVGLLDQVGLGEHHLGRRTSELSGGQRQRVSIARALACDPDLLVLDEAVSALDVTTTAQILRLLETLRRPNSSALFIAHDLALVRGVCDRVAVMYRGRIVESGTAEEVCGDPRHPYTRLLVSSIPHPHPVVQRAQRSLRVTATPRNGHRLGSDGCPFAARCNRVDDRCADFPGFDVIGSRQVACHAVHDELVDSA